MGDDEVVPHHEVTFGPVVFEDVLIAVEIFAELGEDLTTLDKRDPLKMMGMLLVDEEILATAACML